LPQKNLGIIIYCVVYAVLFIVGFALGCIGTVIGLPVVVIVGIPYWIIG
jgi:hypothetical protein